MNKAFGPGDEEDNGDAEGDRLVDSIYDLQAGHGSHVAGMVYARLYG